MTKRAAIKRQTRETSRDHGVLDSRQFMEDSKVRRLPTHAGWSPYPSNDDRDQAYLKTLKPKSEGQAELMTAIDNHRQRLWQHAHATLSQRTPIGFRLGRNIHHGSVTLFIQMRQTLRHWISSK